VAVFSERLRAVEWPPNFKVSNVSKYESKLDPAIWLTLYETVARVARTSRDAMTSYVPIMMGIDALQWLHHLPNNYIDSWDSFCAKFTANFNSLSDKPAQPWDLKTVK